MKSVSGIVFIRDPDSYYAPDAYVVHLSIVRNKEDLLQQLCVKLKFPGYFGYNWDALSDCLRDLHWIEQKYVVLVHDEYPVLDEQAQTRYLMVLVDVVRDLEEGGDHSLAVVFSEEVREVVEPLTDSASDRPDWKTMR